MHADRGSTLFALVLALILAPAVALAELTDPERRMASWIITHEEEAVELLERITRINSGTLNAAGVRAVGDVLEAELAALGFETRWVAMPPSVQRAGHLFARRRGDAGRSVLLIGHLDTVFEPDHPFQDFERDGDRAVGPGVSDMKGGDVAIIFALRAMAAAGVLEDADITVAFIGDEESPGQPLELVRRDLIEAGKRVDVALGFEGATRDGDTEYVSIARRGASEWMLEVEGREAHSSGIFSEDVGAGAIFEAARILNAFYEEVRGEEYLTFNAGAILGGTDVSYDAGENRGTVAGKTNVVPQRVVVQGGLRTISQEQLERAREAMRRVVAQGSRPGTSATITFQDGYPPMAPTDGNRALMASYNEVSEDLGLGTLEVYDPGRRGAADISFVAPYSDGLAGLGMQGRGAHAPGESLDLTSLPAATSRAAIFLYRLTTGAER